MGAVDRNLLRLAVYEILFLDDIPLSVAINEAVSSPRSSGMRNHGSSSTVSLESWRGS